MKNIDKILMLNQPWPLTDIVAKLCEATQILLHDKDYDGHGYELFNEALDRGLKWVKENKKGN